MSELILIGFPEVQSRLKKIPEALYWLATTKALQQDEETQYRSYVNNYLRAEVAIYNFLLKVRGNGETAQ